MYINRYDVSIYRRKYLISKEKMEGIIGEEIKNISHLLKFIVSFINEIGMPLHGREYINCSLLKSIR